MKNIEMYGLMFLDYPDLVTVQDVMKMLGISRVCVYRLIHSGELKALKVGSGYRVPKANVIDFVMKGGET